MATPLVLVHLRCVCGSEHWVLDSDEWGMRADTPSYEDRSYTCPGCGLTRSGFTVNEKSPPAFMLDLCHPDQRILNGDEFGRWLRVFREHFPDHPALARLGED